MQSSEVLGLHRLKEVTVLGQVTRDQTAVSWQIPALWRWAVSVWPAQLRAASHMNGAVGGGRADWTAQVPSLPLDGQWSWWSTLGPQKTPQLGKPTRTLMM